MSNNDKLITNHKHIANTFNNFFIDRPKQIDSNIVKYQDYLLNPVVNKFHLDSTKTEQVHSYINTPKNNKSISLSRISNKLFKQFKKPPSEPLTLYVP